MTRVLVTDDAAFMRVRMTNLLAQEGFDVFQAVSGQQAVAMYANCKPDVVLMDLSMVEGEEIGSVEKIKLIDPEARMIVISSIGQESQVIEALHRGACDFIVKPINQYCLLHKIHNLERVCV